jgi:hypothetical protein
VRIGNLSAAWLPGRQVIGQACRDFLGGPSSHQAVARMARSEVKNYLAELAEEAEMPFDNPAGFLRAVHLEMTRFGSSTGDATCQCTCANCSGCTGDVELDSPFSVINRVEFHGDVLPDDEFCCATPGVPEGVNWPVCSLPPHDDGRHESADYYWIDGPAVLKQAADRNLENLRETGFARDDDS